MASTTSWKLIFLAVLVLEIWVSQSTARSLNDASMVEKHEQWMAQYGRVYKDNAEKAKRYNIFKANFEFIKSFNNAGMRTYKLSINQFADLTNEEFRASRNGYKMSSYKKSTGETSFRFENVTAIPSSMDWRKKGAVTGVKDQGQCGCCWAFSAVAAMEGINQLTMGKLISLSEQELVDCDTSGEDQGCNGGLMDNAFEFILDNHGLTTESNYPYKGVDGTCNTKKESSHDAIITGYEDVPANMDPTSNSTRVEFSLENAGTDLDHGVTAVGYGKTRDGTKYWLVKNSWGTSWGEDGYIRMQRGIDAEEGLCGIAMQASYPTSDSGIA
ncbi:Senescence-specific cysteine protease SAG12 [Abeliophyllum distichum]|uniref:Senescence-specific cysteine protease SAG12 n=1 Tax=Abeliophyllum distichum TaxID=126358 RepID=A0ABD1P3Q0_9LAMI